MTTEATNSHQIEYQGLDSIPDLGAEYRAVVKDKLPVLGTKRSAKSDPTTGVEVKGVSIDTAHLAAYCQAVGLRVSDTVPVTYPYILGFPLAMRVMSAPDFPYSAMGAVHLSNVIEQQRPIRVDEKFDIRVHAENLREHRRGLIVDMVTEVLIGGAVVWKQTSSFLGMGARLSSQADPAIAQRGQDRGTNLEQAEQPDYAATAQWKVTAADIKEYAEASGDKNPVHVSPVGAKAFGFPNVIAHGMWTAAKALTLLEGRTSGAIRYTVDFAKPIVLPAKVACYVAHSEGQWDFQVRKAKDAAKLHATARVEEL